ncbi:MAG TPA: response regulator transcription factor [Candidatus Krumholzibacteria bacterium]|nr:response regulator transcription factor [Candidatus Krumholzibacteria bacterium]
MASRNDTTRLMIVDDHPLVRSGIRSLLQLEGDLEVCGEAEDQDDALAQIAVEQPDLVLVDISLKNSNGLNLLKEIAQNYPGVMTLAVSMHDEYTYAFRCLKAGAKGYIMKQEGTEKILEAIRCVLDGKTYLSPAMTQNAVEQLGQGKAAGASPVEVLSNRELELFQLTGQGKEISEIAEIMNISPRTVEVHRSHIKKKLGLRTSTDIFQAAYEWLRTSGLQP